MFLPAKSILFCIIILMALTSSGVCAELESKEHKEKEYRQVIVLFVGNTQDGSENGTSIGFEYVRRINPHFSIGGLGEYAGGDFDSWVIGIPFYVRPYAEWFVRLAPGLEFADSETNFLFRIGLGYEFELMQRWILSPEINTDFVDGDTRLVYGLTLAWKF